MDKVIRMKATKLPKSNRNPLYRLKITEQSYIQSDFGNPGKNFISSKGFTLRSVHNPAAGEGARLFVQGAYSYGDSYTMDITIEYLIKIMHAVREYNSHVIVANLPVVPEGDTFIIE